VVETGPPIRAAKTRLVAEIRAALLELSPEAREILERAIRGELRARRRPKTTTPRSSR